MAKSPSTPQDEVLNARVPHVEGRLQEAVSMPSTQGRPASAPRPAVAKGVPTATPKGLKKAEEEEEQARGEEDAVQSQDDAAQADAVQSAPSEVLVAQADGAGAAAVLPPGSSAAGAVLPTGGAGVGAASVATGATGLSFGTVALGATGVAALAGAGGGSSGGAPAPAPAPAPVQPPVQPPAPEPTETVHQLTTGLDDVQGGAGKDRVIGDSTTFQAGDMVNGGAGADTLELHLDGGFYGEDATVSNVEVLDLRALEGGSGAVDLSLAGWDDQLATINITEAARDVVLRDQQTLADVNIGESGQNVVLSYGAPAVTGEDDELKVSVNAYTGELTVDSQVESLRLSVDDAAGDDNASQMRVNALAGTTIVGGRAGQGFGLTLTGEDQGTASLDSSAFLGNLTLEAGAHLQTLKTGAGDDTVTMDSLSGTASADLGEGDNHLTIGEDGVTGEASVSLGDGDNTVWIQGGVDGAVGEDISGVSIAFGDGNNHLVVATGLSGEEEAPVGAGFVSNASITFGDGDNRVDVAQGITDSDIRFGDGDNLLQAMDSIRGTELDFGDGRNIVAVGEDLVQSQVSFGDGDDNVVGVGNDIEGSTVTFGDGDGNLLAVGDDLEDSSVSFGEGSGNTVVVADDIQSSAVSFGAGGNTVTVGGDVERGSTITLSGGGSTVDIGGDLDDATIDLADGGNTVNVRGELDDGALIQSSGGDSTVNVGGKLTDGSQITLGSGADTVTVGANEHKQGSVGGKGGQKTLIDTGAGDDQVTLVGSKHYGSTMVRSGGSLQGGEGNDTLTIKAASDIDVVARTEHQKVLVELADSHAAGDVVTLRIGEDEFAHTVEYTSAQVLSFTFGEQSYTASQTCAVTIGGQVYSFVFPGAQGGPAVAAQAVANGIKAELEADGVTGFGTPELIDNGDGTYTLTLTGTSANADNVAASSDHASVSGADGADRDVQTPEEIAEALEALVDSDSPAFSAGAHGGKIVLVAKGDDVAADVSVSLSLTTGGTETQVEGAVTTKQFADAGISGFETLQLEILNNVGEDTDIDAREITADFAYISGVQNVVLDSQVRIDPVTVNMAGDQALVNGAYQRMDEYAGECATDPATEFTLLNLKGDEAITVRGHEVSATGSQQVDRIHIGNQDGDHQLGDVISVYIAGKTYTLTVNADDLSGESAQADAEAIASRLAALLAEGSDEAWPFSVAVDGHLITLVGTDPSLSGKVMLSHTRPNADPTTLYGSGDATEGSVDFSCVDSIQAGDVIRLQLGDETVTYTVLQEDVDACCDRQVADVLAEKVAAALSEAGHGGALAWFGVVTLGGGAQASWAVTRQESSYVDLSTVDRVQKSDAADDREIDVTVKATLANDTDDDTMDLTVDGHGAFDLEIVGDGEGQYEHLNLKVTDDFSHYINTHGDQGNFSESIVLSGGAVGATIHLDQVLAGTVGSTSEANVVVAQYDADLHKGLIGEDTVVNVSTAGGDDHLITYAPALFNDGSTVDLGTGDNTLSLGWGGEDGAHVARTISGTELARVAEISGMTQLQRLNILNGVVLNGDTSLAMMQTTVPQTVEAIDLWDLTVAHGEDADLTISGTAASLLLEASHGNLDLGSKGVLTAQGVSDLRVQAVDDITFALGNDTLDSLSVVSEDDEASVYLRDGSNRTVAIGSVELEGGGDDAKLTILGNTDGAVTVGSLEVEADAEASLTVSGNTNTDVSVGESGGVNLHAGENASLSITGNADNKLEADQVIALGDLSLHAGDDARVTIEDNTANTVTLGAVDMVACDDDASLRIKGNKGIDYEAGVSASVDWATVGSGAIRMDAGDDASLRIEHNTWGEFALADGEDEGIEIKARDDIEFKVRDNTNVKVALGSVALTAVDRISASISDNATEVAGEDGFVSSVSIGDFTATAGDDVRLQIEDNDEVKVTLGDVSLTSYGDDAALDIKGNDDSQIGMGAVTLEARDDASLVIRWNKGGDGHGGNDGPTDAGVKIDGDVSITSHDDDATFSFTKNRGIQLQVNGNVSLKGEDDVRFELNDNKSSVVTILGSGEPVGEDAQAPAAIRLESTDGDVRLSIEDNGSRHGGFFGALLGTVDIDASDEAKLKINDNRGTVVALGLGADTDPSTLLAPLSGSGSIMEGLEHVRDTYLGEGSSIAIDATTIRFEVEDNRAGHGEDSLFDYSVVALGAVSMNATDATGEDNAQAEATLSILDNRETLMVTGDLSLTATASSIGQDADAITALKVGDSGFFDNEQNCDPQGNSELALVTGDIVLDSQATAAGNAQAMASFELSATEDFRIQLGDVTLKGTATSHNASAYAGAGMAVLGNDGGEDSTLEMGDVSITASANPVGEDEFTLLDVSNSSFASAAFTFMENRDMAVKAGDVTLSATASGGMDAEAFAAFHLDENTDVSFEFGDVSVNASASAGFDFAGFSIVDQDDVSVKVGDVKVSTTGAYGLAGVAVGAYSNEGYSLLAGGEQGEDNFEIGTRYEPAESDANECTDVSLGHVTVEAGNDAAVWLAADKHGSLSVGNISVTSAMSAGAESGDIFFYMDDVGLNDALVEGVESGITIELDGSGGSTIDNEVYATLIDTPDVQSLTIKGAYANVFLEGDMDGFATLDLSGVTDFAYVETWDADFRNGDDDLKLSDQVVVKIGSGNLQYNAMYGVNYDHMGGGGRNFTDSRVQDSGTSGGIHGDWNGDNGWYSLGDSGDAYLAPTPHEIYIETWGRPAGEDHQDVYKFTVDGTSYSVAIEQYWTDYDTIGYRMTDFRIGLSDEDVGREAFEAALGLSSFEWNGDDRFVLTGPLDGSPLKPVTTATQVVDDNTTVNHPMEVENIPGHVATDGIGNAVQEVFQFVGESIGEIVIGGFFAKPVGADNVDGVLRWGDRLDFSQFDLNGAAEGLGGRNDLTISVVNNDEGYFSDVLITFNTAGMEDSSILLVGVGNQYGTPSDVITNVTNSIIFA